MASKGDHIQYVDQYHLRSDIFLTFSRYPATYAEMRKEGYNEEDLQQVPIARFNLEEADEEAEELEDDGSEDEYLTALLVGADPIIKREDDDDDYGIEDK